MHASKLLVGATVVSALTFLGCGATATSEAPAGVTTAARGGSMPIATAGGADRAMQSELAAADGTSATAPDYSSLPPAPWASEHMALQAAPAALVRAWRTADNRTWCAPVAPTTLGGSVRARTGEVEGGWMVEFDRTGAPGVMANGRTCARCGRAAFGIVGTSMTPDQEEDAVPAFNDGSRTEIEAPVERGEAAAATLTVAGQGCVYQVWSFLGEDHVRELVQSLRLVDVSDAHAIASVDENGRK